MKKRTIILDGKSLTCEDVHFVAMNGPEKVQIEVAKSALGFMKESRAFIDEIIKSEKTMYGINTGFGALSDKKIGDKDLGQLQINLIRSHCTGVGELFDRNVSRAIMLLRANCLCLGHSGITPSTVQLIVDFLNLGVTPCIPEKGSVGASGDLAPLAHVALALIGEGFVEFGGKVVSSDFALNQIRKKKAILGPKDGLALINGTAVMASLGALAVVEGKKLMGVADISALMTLEGVQGTAVAYDPRITNLKPHPGMIASVTNLNKMIQGSEILDSHVDCERVQDAYSLRCVPQVHGAIRQTLNHCEEIISLELNAVTDNPLVFPEDKEVISGGNFHGQSVAFAMDYLCMGLSEVCSISERRIEKMMNPTFSSLPPFLAKNSGLNSGLMMCHVTAAALVSENKVLCHPASIDSVPTSTDKEDHVSMGVHAGRKLHEVLGNAKSCLAIELLCGTQAIEFLRPRKSSPSIESVHKLIRCHVPPIDEDRVFSSDIENIIDLIENNEITNVVADIIGPIH
jgi:histidine ammonia-lyase